MRAFYGTRISGRMSTTPEGFLICHSVPVARTGEQRYRASELGMHTDEMVTVRREARNVFENAAIASLEGKPITSLHPPVFLSANNASAYQRGHVQNVRRGDRLATGDEVLLADLVITDADLIEKIRNGMRECSVGYAFEYGEDDDGTLTQTKIRANHLAIVPQGRAGGDIRILDHSDDYDPVREADDSFEAACAAYHRKNVRDVVVKTVQDGVVGEMQYAGRPRRWSELKRELNETMGRTDDYDEQVRLERNAECEDFEDLARAERQRLLGRR